MNLLFVYFKISRKELASLDTTLNASVQLGMLCLVSAHSVCKMFLEVSVITWAQQFPDAAEVDYQFRTSSCRDQKKNLEMTVLIFRVWKLLL